MIRVLEWVTAGLVVTSALALSLLPVPERRDCCCPTCSLPPKDDLAEWGTGLREAA